MKKLLSTLLLIVLLVQVLPFDALATVGRVLTEDELARAYALTGLGEGDGLYHNGMKPNLSWNAAQLSDWLEDKLSTVIYNLGDTISRAQYALAELEERDPAAYKRFMEYGNMGEHLQTLTVEAEALREEMRYYQTRLRECSSLIAEMKAALEDDDYGLFDSDRVRYSARIEEAAANLTEDRQYIVENIDAWEAKAGELQYYLTMGPAGEDKTKPFVGAYLSELFTVDDPVANTAKVTAVTASNSRLSRLAADAGLSANDGVDVEIDVLSDRQIGFSLVTEKGGKNTPMPGVSVTVKDALNPKSVEITYTSNDKGNVILPTNQFTTDEYDSIHVKLTVNGEAKGYRDILIDDLDLDLGEPYEIVMKPLSAVGNAVGEDSLAANATGGPYLKSAEFGSKDILYSNYDMIYSAANDYQVEIKVVLEGAAGQPDMTMTWYENDGSFSQLKKCTATASPQNGNVYIFKGPWKQKFSPNAKKEQRPTFSFKEGGKTYSFTSRLVSVRAATEQPLSAGTGPNGGVFSKVLGSGMGFSTDIPLWEGHKLHIGFNLPFTEYLPKMNVDPSGALTMYIGSEVLADIVKGSGINNWKTKDLKAFNKANEKLEKTTMMGDYKAKYGVAYDFYKSKGLKFIGTSDLKFGIFAVATGRWQLDNSDPDVKTKLITVRAGFGFTISYAFSWGIAFAAGPVPLNLTLSIGVSVGASFNFQIDLAWVNGEFQHWKAYLLKNIEFNISFSVAVQFGAGIKGFLEGYVRLGASLNILIALSVQDKTPSSIVITWAATMTVGVTIFWVDLSYTWTFKKGQLYPNETNLLEHYMNAGAGDVEKVEPAYQEPQDYPELAVTAKQLQALPAGTPTKTKLMTIEGDTYLFFLARENSGEARLHWKNLRTGKEQSVQEAFDEYIKYNSYQAIANMSGSSDLGFDAWYGEGMLIIVRCFAYDFYENGFPAGSDADMLMLERQSDGAFLPVFKNTTLIKSSAYNFIEQKSFLAHGEFWKDYATVADPVIDDVRLVWSSKSSRELRGVRMSGMMSRVVPPDRGEDDGVVFFCYNNVKPWDERQDYRRLILHTDQYVGSFSGYKRVQFLSPMRVADYYDRYMGTGVYGFQEGAQDFIALNRSETDSADAFIELYDMRINGTRDERGGYGTASVMKGIKVAEGDIRYMALLPSGQDNVTQLFYTQAERNADGAEQLRLHGLKIQPTKGIDYNSFEVDVTRYDYDLLVNADRFQVGYIGNTPYLYWWNAVAKGDDVNKVVWRVWAAAYDPASETLAAPSVFAQFELPTTRMWIAMNKISEREDVSFVPIGIELTSSGTGYLVAVTEKTADGEKLPRVTLYTFDEELKPVANLQSALAQHTLVKAGSIDDIDIGVMNAGNVALAALDIEMREVDEKGKESAVVETVHVNLHEPAKSKITMADKSQPLTGKAVAHRAEDYDYSPRQRDFVLSQVTTAHTVDISRGVRDTTKDTSSPKPVHLKSDLLMPGSLADIMAAFKIPGNWSGAKKLRLRVVRANIESNWLRAVASANGFVSNSADGDESVELVYELNPETGMMELQMPTVSNSVVANAIKSGLFANEVEAGDEVDLMVHVQDIDVNHRIYTRWDGQDWLSISVKNHAATGDALKLVCAVYVDGSDEPYYLNLPYYQQATSTRRTQTFTLPVSALVDDPSTHDRARVVIWAVDNEENAWANNEFTVYLNGVDPLRFTKQPEDVTAQEGEVVSFTVEVAGGVKPYAYQWQVYNPETGEWVDLPGFTGPNLSRENIEKKWDGCRFRCVVTDSAGTQIISREVTLTVRDGVDTGDHSNLPLYLTVAIAALIMLWWMRRRSA